MSSAVAQTIIDLVAARDWTALENLPDLLDTESDGWSALQVLAQADEAQGFWLNKLRVIQAWRSRDLLTRGPDDSPRPPPTDGMSDDRALVHGFLGRFGDNWTLLSARLKNGQMGSSSRALALWISLDGRILDGLRHTPFRESAAAELLVSVAMEFLADDESVNGSLSFNDEARRNDSLVLSDHLYLDLCTRGHFDQASRLLRAISPSSRLSVLAALTRSPRSIGGPIQDRIPVSIDGRSTVLTRFLDHQLALCQSAPPHPPGRNADRFFDVFEEDDRTPLCQHILSHTEIVREVFRRCATSATKRPQGDVLRSDVLDRLDDDTLLSGPLLWPHHPDLQARLDRALLHQSTTPSKASNRERSL